MASGSGRYQSKVFSFFSQQSLRWRDKANQTLRQVQVAALWGLQILLYPVYTTFQTTRLLSRQIGRSVRQVIPQLQAAKTALTQAAPPSIATDAPIQHTLAALPALLPSLLPSFADAALLGLEQPSPEAASIAASIEPSADAAPTQAAPLTIQAIASQLDTHDLVLVTATNQILDILTSEQQAHLHRQIVWEVADYWRQQRLRVIQASQTLQLTSRALPLIGDRPKAWLPIRVFYRLMAWMQTSPVALATDLFQESQVYLEAVDRGTIAALPSGSGARSSGDDLALRSATPTWSSLDELFDDFLPSPQSDSTSDSQILSRLQASLMEIAQRSAQFASQLLQKSGIVLYTAPTAPSPPSPPSPTQPLLQPESSGNPIIPLPVSQPSGIEQLRQKFFDRLNSHLQVQEPLPIKRVANLPPTSQPNWETFDPTQSRTLTPLITESKVVPPVRASRTASIVAATAISSAISPIEEYPSCPIALRPEATALQAPNPTDSESSALTAPTYIEAEVKLVQYVKHPLEQVLEWLDLGMLWIEKQLAEMVKWLSDRMR